MSEATIIFPHQLFKQHSAVKPGRPVYLVEHAHFFTRYRFHKQKIAFHKATMIEYELFLKNRGFTVELISLEQDLWEVLASKRVAKIHCAHVHDCVLEKLLLTGAEKESIQIQFYESPYFMTSMERFELYFASKERFHFTSFYREQRAHFNILMTAKKAPVGGKLTFDTDNRKKLPGSHPLPALPKVGHADSLTKAIKWAESFADHPGLLDEWIYPVTHQDAEAWLENFLEHRLSEFGPYQDALSSEQSILFHSLVSPLLNVGLLTPAGVIEKTLSFAEQYKIPLNSLEGFIRQIIGWREYVYGIYRFHGAAQQQSNYFDHTHKLPQSFWKGTTGIEPIDIIIKRVLQTAYAHHIERLMVLGNFMLLCDIDPDEVYLWFMELFIDAYDWVMIPNVYGMSQFADGGMMTTKPYIAGGNYLKKMGTYDAGVWEKVYTDLYWRFIAKNYGKLLQVPRLRSALSAMQTSNPSKYKLHVRDAELFLNYMRSNL